MLKKTMTYRDFDGNKRTEDFYFNLSKAEITEMETSVSGGMSTLLKQVVGAKDMRQVVQLFKQILLKSYGEKSPDGRRFVKSEELSKAFSETGAYDELFMELATDVTAATAFVTALIPQDLVPGDTAAKPLRPKPTEDLRLVSNETTPNNAAINGSIPPPPVGTTI